MLRSSRDNKLCKLFFSSLLTSIMSQVGNGLKSCYKVILTMRFLCGNSSKVSVLT